MAIERRSSLGKARVALARKLSVILHSVWRCGPRFVGRRRPWRRSPSKFLCSLRRSASPLGEGAGNSAVGAMGT
jgi:hypothetical protein